MLLNEGCLKGGGEGYTGFIIGAIDDYDGPADGQEGDVGGAGGTIGLKEGFSASKTRCEAFGAERGVAFTIGNFFMRENAGKNGIGCSEPVRKTIYCYGIDANPFNHYVPLL